MKHDWEYKKMEDVCTAITDGSHFSPKSNESGIYPMLSVKDMSDNGFDYTDCKLIGEEDYQNMLSNGCKPLVNDVLVAKDGSYLKTAFVQTEDCEQAVLSSIAIIRPKQEILYSKYVALFFKAPKTKREIENHYLTGSAIKRVILKGFRSLYIPVPPLPTQQSIVSELDSLSKIIADCKETLKDYDALEQSIFYDMFGDPVKNEKGWEVKKLGEVASIKTGPFGSLLHKHDYISGGIPLVNPIHMRNFQIEPSYDLTITEEKANELKEYVLKENDVVLARRGDIGRCAIVSKKENGYLCGTGSLFIRFKESISPVFTMYVVKSDSFVKHLQQCSKGATMLNLNTTTVSNLQIIIPPLPLQQQFASKIEAIEKMKSETKKALQEAETLFNARMDYWFN